MSVCIISGRYPETKFKSYINHKVYADYYGYNYVHCNWPTRNTNNYFNKVVYVLSYLNNFEYVIWIDDDAFFFDFETDIMNYAPKDGSFISFCKSPTFKNIKTILSSGQFIVKSNSDSEKFFKDILNTDLKIVKDWWRDELGYFSNGDQDAMVYHLLENINYKNKMDLYDYRYFNSRYENLFDIDKHKPLILHFTGTKKIKEENYLKTQNKLNLHPSLVANSLLKGYNITIKENYTISMSKIKLKSKILKLGRYLFND
ncbi:putative nucleotide-diphospho-sugar transferase [Winogradskyella sp.]|uniref:putative nucleotide-diphospho-sugar transferase n=1 Tax=Winogradskyella sp. TaxID=1883156 RepID=UPI003F6ABB50